MSRRDTFRDDRTLGITPDMNHLRARIRLLIIIGHGHRIEFPDRVITRQDAAGIFPGNSGTCFHLRPGDLAVISTAKATFRYEVIDTALSILITRIPILYGRIFHLCPFLRDNLHDCRMKLVLITHRSRTSFQITNISVIIRHDQCPLELSRVCRIDTEIGTQLHRTTNAFRNINKRAIREYRGIQCRIKVIPIAHNSSQIFPYQIRMILNRFTERAEDNPFLGQSLLERCLYRDTIHHGIDRHTTQVLLLLKRYAQLIKRFQQLRINLIRALRPLLLFGSGIINDILEVDLRNIQMSPFWQIQSLPIPERFQTELKQPLRFLFFGGNQTDSLLIQSAMNNIRVNIRHETILIIAFRYLIQYIVRFLHTLNIY